MLMYFNFVQILDKVNNKYYLPISATACLVVSPNSFFKKGMVLVVLPEGRPVSNGVILQSLLPIEKGSLSVPSTKKQ